MHNKDIYNFIRNQVPELDETDLVDFCSKWNMKKSLKRNELFTLAENIYFIKKGAVKVYTEIEERHVILDFGYKGLCIFDLPTFLGKPSEYYFESIKDSELIGISKDDYHHFIKSNPLFGAFWYKGIEQLIVNFVEREVDLLTHSPKLKYERLLKRKPELFQHIPQKYIANYLGLSPETLSRLSKS